MPRVQQKKKNNAGEPYSCARCAEKIVAGQAYFEWSFRYGGTHRQHTTHGSPKPSQLTQSKMSTAYAAIESAEEAIANAESIEDLTSALEECAGEINGVADEYQDSFDNIPENLQQGGPAQEIQEKIDALQSFASDIEGLSFDDFEEEEPERDEFETDAEYEAAQAEWEEKRDEHLDTHRSTAEDALAELSI